jgi:hypothetical protein
MIKAVAAFSSNELALDYQKEWNEATMHKETAKQRHKTTLNQ